MSGSSLRIVVPALLVIVGTLITLISAYNIYIGLR